MEQRGCRLLPRVYSSTRDLRFPSLGITAIAGVRDNSIGLRFLRPRVWLCLAVLLIVCSAIGDARRAIVEELPHEMVFQYERRATRISRA